MIERVWVSIVDSPRFRRFAGGRLGRSILAGDGVRLARSAFVRARARSDANRLADDFAGVKRCVLFIGHTKSGGSLTGAMLDAHPSVVCGDEVDLLARLDSGLDRDELFTLLVKSSKREALKGRVTARRLEPYSLAIPSLWQGSYDALTVVGDSRAGPTTRSLARDPDLLGRLESVLGDVVLHVIQVVRAPEDPIGAMVGRSGRSLDDAIDDYRAQCERLVSIRGRLPEGRLTVVRYEDLVSETRPVLERLCNHLGIDPVEEWLRGCEHLVTAAPPPDRARVAWSDHHHGRVREIVQEFDFLSDVAGMS